MGKKKKPLWPLGLIFLVMIAIVIAVLEMIGIHILPGGFIAPQTVTCDWWWSWIPGTCDVAKGFAGAILLFTLFIGFMIGLVVFFFTMRTDWTWQGKILTAVVVGTIAFIIANTLFLSFGIIALIVILFGSMIMTPISMFIGILGATKKATAGI